MKSTNYYVKIFALLLTISLVGCSEKRYFNETKQIVKSMSLEEKIGQLIMVALPNGKITPLSKKIIKQYKPGGIIYFGYNLRGDIKQFSSDLQNLSMNASGIPLFISLDQEGGRVKRITRNVTQFPGNMAAGVTNKSHLVQRWGEILGVELRQLGINMNLIINKFNL